MKKKRQKRKTEAINQIQEWPWFANFFYVCLHYVTFTMKRGQMAATTTWIKSICHSFLRAIKKAFVSFFTCFMFVKQTTERRNEL